MQKALLLLFPLLLFGTGCTTTKHLSRITAQALHDLRSPDADERRNAAVQLRFKDKEKRWVMPELAKYVEAKDPIFALRCHESLQYLTGNENMPQERRTWETYINRLLKALDTTGKPPEDIIRHEKARLRNEEGILFMSQGDFLSAEQYFLEALGLDTGNADYHNNLAKNYLNMRRYDDALRYSMRAIALKPDLAVAYMNEGEAYAGLDKSYEATNAYLEALKRDKDKRNWAVRWKLAKLYLRQNMLDEAHAQISDAIKINPRQPHLHVSAALIRYGRQEYFRSWQEVEKVQQLGYDWEDDAFLRKLKVELRRMGMEFPEDDEDKDRPPPALDLGDFAPNL